MLKNLLFIFALFGSIFPQPVQAAAFGQTASTDYTLTYTLDRSTVPALTYNDLTLKINVGDAQSVTASAETGKTALVSFKPATGFALVTTNGSTLQVHVNHATSSAQIGAFTKTTLKDDYQWAWSHSFDDNIYFKQYGIPLFEQYGYRGSLYLIGDKLNTTHGEMWNFDESDVQTMVKKGWGIGNHTMEHFTVYGSSYSYGSPAAAQTGIETNAALLRQLVDQAGRTDYRLIAFAAPMFDANYHPIITSMRAAHDTELLFDESGSSGFMQVDANAPAQNPLGINNASFTALDSTGLVGRDWRIESYGKPNNADDQSFRADFATMIANLNADTHYWLNTFTHNVDSQYGTNETIFGFLPWVYNTYGPAGNHSVWIAPSDEIYSYIQVRNAVNIQLAVASTPSSKALTFTQDLPFVFR